MNKFEKYYDASYYKQNKTNKKYNKVLTELIKRNKIIKNSPQDNGPITDLLSGPRSISKHHITKYNKTIYIFGERHGYDDPCAVNNLHTIQYDIVFYLEELFDSSDKFIDFFLEDTLFALSDNLEYKGFLRRLRKKFNNCLNPSYRQNGLCKWNTIRTHFVDVRSVGVYKNTPWYRKSQNIASIMGTNPIDSLIHDIWKKDTINFGKLDKHRKIINKLSDIKKIDDLVELIIQLSLDIPIVNKELNRSFLDKTEVLDIWRSVIGMCWRNINSFPSFNKINWKSWKSISNNSNILISISSHFVDIYTIARTFKDFNTDNQPKTPYNCIYYFGDAHAMNLRYFLDILESNGNKDLSKWDLLLSTKTDVYTSNRYNNERCLDMRNVKQPLFS